MPRRLTARSLRSAAVRVFVEHLARGTKLHQTKIDEIIAQYSDHWPLERMAVAACDRAAAAFPADPTPWVAKLAMARLHRLRDPAPRGQDLRLWAGAT